MSDKVKNDEVKNEEAEQEIPVIMYKNADGDEIEIPMSDLNEAETNIANNLNGVIGKLQEIDEVHVKNLTRQSLVMNQELLTDALQRELIRFDKQKPQIITKTKEIKS
jgi:hypothetical protein